ncbi:MAG: rubrerythrin family protein, partial [Muribaculaceae bacterium]|nr:rubrerythrin family protein [Muribaculaceae bacterium]
MSTTKSTPSIKGTKTEQNLVNAFIAESQAYTRYTYYADKAKKEGYFPIQKIFEDTAANELRHGKVYMKFLQGGTVPCNIAVDAVNIQDTAANLEIAIHEESTEGYEVYLANAKVAEEEGLIEIAEHFRSIASIEEHHMKRFQKCLEHVKNGTLWKREKPIKWECLVCGYIYEGTEPPKTCPACDHPYQHYM